MAESDGGDDFHFSWVDEGALPPIRDQRGPTCWAFAAIATIEAANKIHTGNLVHLSEQHLLDCDYEFNHGWGYGKARLAYAFLCEHEGRVYGQDVYPWKKTSDVCLLHWKPNLPSAVTIDGFCRVVPVYDEEALKRVVTEQPVAAVMRSDRIQRHKRGIVMYDETERELPPDHFVVIVGYGRENGIDYWLCRNCWGETWGEKGYFRLQRNVGDGRGTCGIARRCYFPIMGPENATSR